MNTKAREGFTETIAQIQQARHQTALAWGTQKITWDEMVEELERLDNEEALTEKSYIAFLGDNRIFEELSSFKLGNMQN
jgi:hypothetical protein